MLMGGFPRAPAPQHVIPGGGAVTVDSENEQICVTY